MPARNAVINFIVMVFSQDYNTEQSSASRFHGQDFFSFQPVCHDLTLVHVALFMPHDLVILVTFASK